MSTIIYLIRHCQSIANAERRYNSDIAKDNGLSRLGHMQSEYLTRFMSKKKLNAIYSSPFKRTLETATPIAKEYKLQVQTVDALRELNCGQWNEHSELEIRAKFPNQWNGWNQDPERNPIPGGESLIQVQSRALPALEEIVKKHPNQRIAIVTHYGILNVLVCSLVSSLANYRCFDTSNATVAEIDMDHHIPRLRYYGSPLPDSL